jgi:putative transposase
MLEETFGVKERRACRVVGQHRSTQRLATALPDDDEQELRRWLVAFAKDHPRWGWKRATQHLRREGHRVNPKRVQRLWRLEGLKVPYRKRKKPLRGLGVHVGAMSPICPNAIWAMDFQFDETRNGKQLKLLNIQDIFTRECLAVKTERSITADDVTTLLDRLVANTACRPTCAVTMVPSSRPMPLPTGVASTAQRRRSSIPAHLGRTATSSRSTRDCATSS